MMEQADAPAYSGFLELSSKGQSEASRQVVYAEIRGCRLSVFADDSCKEQVVVFDLGPSRTGTSLAVPPSNRQKAFALQSQASSSLGLGEIFEFACPNNAQKLAWIKVIGGIKSATINTVGGNGDGGSYKDNSQVNQANTANASLTSRLKISPSSPQRNNITTNTNYNSNNNNNNYIGNPKGMGLSALASNSPDGLLFSDLDRDWARARWSDSIHVRFKDEDQGEYGLGAADGDAPEDMYVHGQGGHGDDSNKIVNEINYSNNSYNNNSIGGNNTNYNSDRGSSVDFSNAMRRVSGQEGANYANQQDLVNQQENGFPPLYRPITLPPPDPSNFASANVQASNQLPTKWMLRRMQADQNQIQNQGQATNSLVRKVTAPIESYNPYANPSQNSILNPNPSLSQSQQSGGRAVHDKPWDLVKKKDKNGNKGSGGGNRQPSPKSRPRVGGGESENLPEHGRGYQETFAFAQNQNYNHYQNVGVDASDKRLDRMATTPSRFDGSHHGSSSIAESFRDNGYNLRMMQHEVDAAAEQLQRTNTFKYSAQSRRGRNVDSVVNSSRDGSRPHDKIGGYLDDQWDEMEPAENPMEFSTPLVVTPNIINDNNNNNNNNIGDNDDINIGGADDRQQHVKPRRAMRQSEVNQIQAIATAYIASGSGGDEVYSDLLAPMEDLELTDSNNINSMNMSRNQFDTAKPFHIPNSNGNSNPNGNSNVRVPKVPVPGYALPRSASAPRIYEEREPLVTVPRSRDNVHASNKPFTTINNIPIRSKSAPKPNANANVTANVTANAGPARVLAGTHKRGQGAYCSSRSGFAPKALSENEKRGESPPWGAGYGRRQSSAQPHRVGALPVHGSRIDPTSTAARGTRGAQNNINHLHFSNRLSGRLSEPNPDLVAHNAIRSKRPTPVINALPNAISRNVPFNQHFNNTKQVRTGGSGSGSGRIHGFNPYNSPDANNTAHYDSDDSSLTTSDFGEEKDDLKYRSRARARGAFEPLFSKDSVRAFNPYPNNGNEPMSSSKAISSGGNRDLRANNQHLISRIPVATNKRVSKGSNSDPNSNSNSNYVTSTDLHRFEELNGRISREFNIPSLGFLDPYQVSDGVQANHILSHNSNLNSSRTQPAGSNFSSRVPIADMGTGRAANPRNDPLNISNSAEWERLMSWLDSIDMSHYAAVFKSHRLIKMSELELLTSNDLRNIGIDNESDRDILMRCIAAFSRRTNMISDADSRDKYNQESGNVDNNKSPIMSPMNRDISSFLKEKTHGASMQSAIANSGPSSSSSNPSSLSPVDYMYQHIRSFANDRQRALSSSSLEEEEQEEEPQLHLVLAEKEGLLDPKDDMSPQQFHGPPVHARRGLGMTADENPAIFSEGANPDNKDRSEVKYADIILEDASIHTTLLLYFDSGNHEQFEVLWNAVMFKLFPPSSISQLDSRHNINASFVSILNAKIAIEFYIYLYFAICELKANNLSAAAYISGSAEEKTEVSSTFKESRAMDKYRSFLDTLNAYIYSKNPSNGDRSAFDTIICNHSLWRSKEFIICCGVALVPQPHAHSLLSPLFQLEWATSLKVKVSSFLQSIGVRKVEIATSKSTVAVADLQLAVETTKSSTILSGTAAAATSAAVSVAPIAQTGSSLNGITSNSEYKLVSFYLKPMNPYISPSKLPANSGLSDGQFPPSPPPRSSTSPLVLRSRLKPSSSNSGLHEQADNFTPHRTGDGVSIGKGNDGDNASGYAVGSDRSMSTLTNNTSANSISNSNNSNNSNFNPVQGPSSKINSILQKYITVPKISLPILSKSKRAAEPPFPSPPNSSDANPKLISNAKADN